MPVSRARRLAYDVLYPVNHAGAYASDLLHARLNNRVSRADAALATELVLGVLRWQRLLDFLLERHLRSSTSRLDAEVLLALRLGLYQLRFLERIPPHAAVDESVELVKRAKKRSAATLVNAVLRHVAAEARLALRDLQTMLPPDTPPAERTAILLSHPTWLTERWILRHGPDRARALLEANNRPPRLCCAVLDAQSPAALENSLRADGLEVSSAEWLRTARTISGGNPLATESFRFGKILLQDEASQMVAHLLDSQPGQEVLDLCAAPGGKAMLLARAVAPSGSVIAADLHLHRLRAMREQFARTATGNAFPLALDATRSLPFTRPFQRILLDAPCSGTGTLARNPEIRWRLQPADLTAARRRQTAMLEAALVLLAPGGRLVYSTCSLEPEENDQVVDGALARHPEIRVVRGSAALTLRLRPGTSPEPLFDPHGYFRTFPPETNTDGFFAAVLERLL